ncbi:MAG TPA: response regulator transcription factor [Burkholderiales bacterium]|nr:response regulator transcription factor [Burkholderiales bacterium]
MPASALIVEDHPLFRDALIQLVRDALPNVTPVAASSAEEGLRLADSLEKVSLILLDPGLPGMNGAEAISAFSRALPGAGLVAVSASEDRRDAMAALRAGAKVFVSKAVSTETLGELLARMIEGKVERQEWITPSGSAGIEEDAETVLTPRQREILALLAQGHSNKEIGLRLEVAEITVKMHVSAIFRALNVANRTQAVLVARRLGILQN